MEASLAFRHPCHVSPGVAAVGLWSLMGLGLNSTGCEGEGRLLTCLKRGSWATVLGYHKDATRRVFVKHGAHSRLSRKPPCL